MKFSITKRLEWDSAHRVLRHESKCATLHGHRYAAEITCTAQELDGCARVVDFGVIKAEVGKWIDDSWDHTTLVNQDDVSLLAFVELSHAKEPMRIRAPYVFRAEPTAETIAGELLMVARRLLEPHGVTVTKVRVYETPTSCAEVE